MLIQIRHVPTYIHRRLKSKAAEVGLTLSDFILREVTQLAERPTAAELAETIRNRGKVTLPESSAVAVRAERGHRL